MRSRAWLALLMAVSGACLWWAPAAHAAGPGGLVVIPVPASGSPLSYFKLSLKPGQSARAGTIGLRNPTSSTLRVALGAVDGGTLDTLGSSYAVLGTKAHGATSWLAVGSGRVTLPPGRAAVVPISVRVPLGAGAGDYLAGVSVEDLGQQAPSAKRKGVSIASVYRYAIGVEVSLPGPRQPLIQFTGASLQRQPAGVTFLLLARNPGNVILQGVRGYVRITRAGHVVISRPIGPGTFVTATSIAYPVPAFSETPAEGTCYRIDAWLRYAGPIAQLHSSLCFGRRQAEIQQSYGGPRVRSGSGTAWWKIALLAGAILYGLLTTILLLRRRRRREEQERGATKPTDDSAPESGPV